uniref:Uncharacterized protein n=1 Tax=Romanomermis culicivorax TaxID=13658 RepID=A0A915HFE2_ROMCU
MQTFCHPRTFKFLKDTTRAFKLASFNRAAQSLHCSLVCSASTNNVLQTGQTLTKSKLAMFLNL